MKLFNEQALNAISQLDSADAAYCSKLEQRFANMGVSAKMTSDAICTLAQKEAIPQAGSWVATPSMFKGIFGKKAKTAKASQVAAPAFDEALTVS